MINLREITDKKAINIAKIASNQMDFKFKISGRDFNMINLTHNGKRNDSTDRLFLMQVLIYKQGNIDFIVDGQRCMVKNQIKIHSILLDK